MNILLIGSGGREHALAWKMKQSDKCDTLYCVPGNGGTQNIATNIDLDVGNHKAIVDFARENDVSFVVIGPEAPLVAGLADDLQTAGITVFGPSAKAALLEGSKGFTKDICAQYDIPTARYGRFDNEAAALAYLAAQEAPIVIKADGLAAGKGVIMAKTMDEAQAAIKDIFAGMFGLAGAQVVIEDWLVGEEASFFVLCDGENAVPLATAQDHKRVGDGDTGPNTGGMGAYSPAPVMSDEMCQRTMDEIILPTIKAMNDKGTPFRGVFFAGLMISEQGPQLIEYNVRFGDPECQALMMRLDDDLVDLLWRTATGKLAGRKVNWRDDAALCVVMAAKGYPGSYEKGSPVGGLEAAGAPQAVEIFHAGTARRNGDIIATGGRVLNVTALGKSISQAQETAYAAVKAIDWRDGFYRSDIGWRAVEREKGD